LGLLQVAVSFRGNDASSGKLAPLLPEEYVTNIVQNKWNWNGFVVNNTYSVVQWSSYKQQKIRTDGVMYGMKSDNYSDPSPWIGNQQISLLDFTVSPPINTYMGWSSLADKPKCVVSGASWLPPPKATWLRDVGAIYAGTEYIPYFGKCEKWSVISPLGIGIVLTMFFDAWQTFVRYDFISTGSGQQQVGVVTLLFNLRSNINIDPTIFAGSGKCPSWSNQVSQRPKGEPTVEYVPFHTFRIY